MEQLFQSYVCLVDSKLHKKNVAWSTLNILRCTRCNEKAPLSTVIILAFYDAYIRCYAVRHSDGATHVSDCSLVALLLVSMP